MSINEILDAIRGILGRPLRIEDLGERPGDVPAYYASSARLTAATGWKSEVGLVEGLRRTIAYDQALGLTCTQQGRADSVASHTYVNAGSRRR